MACAGRSSERSEGDGGDSGAQGQMDAAAVDEEAGGAVFAEAGAEGLDVGGHGGQKDGGEPDLDGDESGAGFHEEVDPDCGGGGPKVQAGGRRG